MKLLTIFIYLLTISMGHTSEKPDIKNLILIKNLKTYENVIFKDANEKDLTREIIHIAYHKKELTYLECKYQFPD